MKSLHALILFLVGICVGVLWKDVLEQGFSSAWEFGRGGETVMGHLKSLDWYDRISSSPRI